MADLWVGRDAVAPVHFNSFSEGERLAKEVEAEHGEGGFGAAISDHFAIAWEEEGAGGDVEARVIN